jgi:hypothetical protein
VLLTIVFAAAGQAVTRRSPTTFDLAYQRPASRFGAQAEDGRLTASGDVNAMVTST